MTAPREFYERLWRGQTDDENASRGAFQEDLVERALSWLGDVSGLRLLEIGPGFGRESARLASRGAKVVAIDVTRSSLVRTHEANPSVATAQAVAEALPFTTASLDRVFLQTTLMHLDLAPAAAEWERVLKSGGRVVVLEPLNGNPLVALYRALLSPYRETRPRYVTLAGLTAAASGFRVLRHEEHYLIAVLALLIPGDARQHVRRALAWLDRGLLRLPLLPRLAWMTLVELEKR